MKAEPVAPNIGRRFEEADFEILKENKNPGAFGVKKYNCLWFLERTSHGTMVPSGPPYFIIRGMSCELEDRGYQKFWYHNGRRFPVHQANLKNLHRFDEEVRTILGLKSLYHESLGTTSARSVYDRLDGRSDK